MTRIISSQGFDHSLSVVRGIHLANTKQLLVMKKIKITLSILFSVITFLYSHGQTSGGIFEGDVTLTTQAEVDAFSYTEVTGTLTISGNDISNLSTLSQLTRAGNLILRANASLADLSGLSALSEVYSIDVSDNPMLANLDALSSVTVARDGITISNNASLESINGFSMLAGDVRGITISGNPQLKSVNGFQSLTRLLSYDGGDLVIDNNASLTSIDGLSSLSGIYGKSGSIQITNNAALLNIDGLSSFQTFVCTATFLNISNNTSLKNLDGLSSLSQMGTDDIGTILIENNAALENIDGLSQLRTPFDLFTQYSIIKIKNNTALSQCDGVKPLLESMGGEALSELIQMGNIEVSGNDSGCTLEEIIAGIPQSIYAFSLIDENGGSLIRSFDSVTVDLGNPYYVNTAVQAKTFPSPVGSVVFLIDNQLEIVDNDYPYAVSLATLGAGVHHVTCELYSLADKQGEKGNGKSFVINILSTPQICEGDVVLASQADVDAFTCTEVTGTLLISGNDITNLNALSALTAVGKLRIEGNPSLPNVNGLSNLIHAGDFHESSNPLPFVNISNNQALTDLNGLSSLRDVGGPLVIDNNDLLETINGFTSLPLIAHTLQISNNDRLQSINGFSGVTEINSFFDSQLIIDNNASLTNVDGLSSLRSFRGKSTNVQIINNTSLPNVDGLMSLSFLNGTTSLLDISGNAVLKDLDGLASLRVVGLDQLGTIHIENNALLENIDGLSQIRTQFGQISQFPRITIIKNPSLSECDGLYPLLVSIGWDVVAELINLGTLKIADNGPGCTLEDILANNPQTISIFSLINLRTGSIINSFQNTVTLDLVDPDFSDWGVQAHTFPTKVGSVEFTLKGKRHTENNFPYVLDLPRLDPGTYDVKTDVYSKSNKRGIKGAGKTATIVVKNSAAIESYDLVDATGSPIKPLNDGDEINISDAAFSKSVNIRANVSDNHITSVRFFLNGVFVRREKSAPFAFNGNNDEGYYPWKPAPGDYTILAVPYVVRNNKEYEGKSLTVHFKVVNENAATANRLVTSTGLDEEPLFQEGPVGVSIYPVPVGNELNVKIDDVAAGKDAMLTIVNFQGLTLYKNSYGKSQTINTLELKPGVYMLQIVNNSGFRRVVKFIKK